MNQPYLVTYPNQEILYHATNTFSLLAHHRKHFSHYFLLHWEPDYFSSQVNQNCIVRDGLTFRLLETPTLFQPYMRISFRKLADLPFGFVLTRDARHIRNLK